ncbi:polyubiquitin 9 [Physcomitrium patens]|uniref:Ubiquitin-like domain-containing protein n=1 Tax=Physcomitrium patens TaxID=3218 RepID=A0A2K1LBV0_PHYPA|nr:uncharacterized protein LOC112284327 [Physcomitrium patens]PNR63506.1 hypothetical protein PHYPA_001932 [Physcomitrium patens]|eukprot:XP_024379810.1 uncharacterized protein LOC112284327 [Physcomitrella patens]
MTAEERLYISIWLAAVDLRSFKDFRVEIAEEVGFSMVFSTRGRTRVRVRVEIRGFRNVHTRKFFHETIKLEMQNSDTVASLRSKIRELQGVRVSEHVLTTHGGVVNDAVKLGDTFKFPGEDAYHCFYLWFCECHDCLLLHNAEDAEPYMPITIGNAPLPLTMMVKPTFTVTFLRSYLGILFHGNTNLSHKGNKLKDRIKPNNTLSTLADYNITANGCVEMTSFASSSQVLSQVINTATKDQTPEHFHTLVTCGELKDFFHFALRTPFHHQLIRRWQKGVEVPVCDDHKMGGGKTFIYRCGWPDFKIRVVSLGVDPLSFYVNGADTVATVKRRIHKECVRMACDKQRLLLDGRILEDDDYLLNSNVKEGSTLILIVESGTKKGFTCFGAH